MDSDFMLKKFRDYTIIKVDIVVVSVSIRSSWLGEAGLARRVMAWRGENS